MRIAKSTVRSLICRALQWRLRYFPISEASADYWARQIKRWPGIFNGFDLTRRTDLPQGFALDLGVVDAIERSLLTCSKWDCCVGYVLKTYLKPGDVFLDAGANIGYFTLMGSRIVGENGLVIALEPSMRAARKLIHHIRLNKCSNVLYISSAVGREPAINKLSLATESNIGGSSIARDDATQNVTELISIRCIDDICSELGASPHVIKLDIEGYELNALRGASGTLCQCSPIVVCELTDHFLVEYGGSASKLTTYMESMNYRCYCMERTANGIRVMEFKGENPPIEQSEVLFLPQGAPLPDGVVEDASDC